VLNCTVCEKKEDGNTTKWEKIDVKDEKYSS
jgi:hypothetical protein